MTWRPINKISCTNYECSIDGKVRNKKSQRLVRSYSHKDTGYSTIVLSENGIPKCFNLHRLIALSHIPNPENYLEIDHINRDKSNNNIQNLRWCSRQQNMQFYAESIKSLL